MSEGRTIEQWRNCSPAAMVAGSAAQVLYALRDAKHDILALHDENTTLRAERDAAQEELARLREALAFYRDNWIGDMEGDGETPGLSRLFQRPNDDLFYDAGDRARAALEHKP